MQEYSKQNDVDAISFNMHSTRVAGKHWTWGITYCQTKIDWEKLFLEKDEIRIVSKNTDKESRIEFLRRFLLADGMIAGFRNFGLAYIAKE